MSIKFSAPAYKNWLWLGLGLVLLAIIAFLVSWTPVKAKQYPAYIATSPSPSGTKALYTVLQNNLPQVSQWKKPVQNLPLLSSKELMLMVNPAAALSPKETEAWISWLESGNTLWLIKSDLQGEFALQTTLITPAANQPATDAIQTLYGHAEFNGTYQALVKEETRLLPQSEDTILLEDNLGVLALAREYGQGELVVTLSPDWLTNENILQHDHLNLLLMFINRSQPDILWFNEYLHGDSDWISMLMIYPRWYLIILMQMSIAAILILWSRAKRFDQIQTVQESAIRFDDERLRSLAIWYERGSWYQEALIAQEQYLRHVIREKWGIVETLSDTVYLETAQKRLNPSKFVLWARYWQENSKHSPTSKLSAKAYLQLSKRLAFMQKEVERR